MGPWTSNRDLVSTRIDFVNDFIIFLEHFWEALGFHLEVILASFSHRCYEIVFGGVLEAFWSLGSFGALFRSKWPLGAKKSIFKKH